MNTTTCNLARMNMLVHNVNFNKFSIHQGDTLKAPSDEQREYGKMDVVVANPPFSASWDPNSTMEKMKDSQELENLHQNLMLIMPLLNTW